jgi:hypothetical protein
VTTDSDDALAVLVLRSQAGDDRALAELRENLPDLVRWTELEHLAQQAREAWAAAGPGAERRADRLRRLEKAAARLVRPGAGPLEGLLAGRAALATARLADLRWLAERAGSEGPTFARDIGRRVRRAEREAAAADRTLRAFQERLAPGP